MPPLIYSEGGGGVKKNPQGREVEKEPTREPLKEPTRESEKEPTDYSTSVMRGGDGPECIGICEKLPARPPIDVANQ